MSKWASIQRELTSPLTTSAAILLVSAAIAIASFVKYLVLDQGRLGLILGLGGMIASTFLQASKQSTADGEDVEQEPLGLARGSVRSMLALGMLAIFAIYLFQTQLTKGEIDSQVFTAVSTLLGTITAFYFGTRSAPLTTPTAVQVVGITESTAPSKLSLKGAVPATAMTGGTTTVNVRGAGFTKDTKVRLLLGTIATLIPQSVNVQSETLLDCEVIFTQVGDWDIEAQNPGEQPVTIAKAIHVQI